MDQDRIRNVAIIAHVDHGKTTLVDQMFRQSGAFRENQEVVELIMDSMDLERERGITIASKNGSFRYGQYRVNIIDTPGHADFGGQVERVLRMADGAILLVDAQEGPMPQTFFVLRKALALRLPLVVCINKIDKPAARCHWVADEILDLFIRLDAPDDLLDFPIVYCSGREGYATDDPDRRGIDLRPLLEKVVESIPPPTGDSSGPPQMLVSSIDYSPYLGRLAIGKITSGSLATNQDIVVAELDGSLTPRRITKLYRFELNGRVPTEQACAGDIVAVAGIGDITVGVTLTDPDEPLPLPPLSIDPPTVCMGFIANDSPFAGKEGTYVTSRHLADRLSRETLADVALRVEELPSGNGFNVSGRGELHLSILIERMRREGYELQVTRPQVICVEENGKVLEPYEDLTVDVAEDYVGNVIEKVSSRKGRMLTMEHGEGMVRMVFRIPTRGLLGYRSEFLTDTRGMGVMNYVFAEYGPQAGTIRRRKNGVLVSTESGEAVAYALFNLQERGRFFIAPGQRVYRGQIVGENNRESDLSVNVCKGKKLTNVRASGSDESVILTPPVRMSLEDCLAFINDDELVEVTPKGIRLRKQRFHT